LGYNPPDIPPSTIDSSISIAGGTKDLLIPLKDLIQMKEMYKVNSKHFYVYNSAHYLFWGE